MTKSNKKPTMMEVKNVISNALVHMSQMEQHIRQLDTIIAKYIKFNNHSNDFKKFLDKEFKENDTEQTTGSSNKGTYI